MGLISYRFSWLCPKVAVDVGTFRLRVASVHTEEVLEVPSCSSLTNGVVVYPERAISLLRPLLSGVGKSTLIRPLVLACTPSDVSEDERQRLVDTIRSAGAASVVVVPEPLAAAIGGGLDVSLPYAQLVIDIGEGVVDCAVIKSGALIANRAIRGGCAELRRMLVEHCALNNVQADGCLRRLGVDMSARMAGENGVVLDGYIGVVNDFLEVLAAAICEFIAGLPSDIGAEVIESGVMLTGGGALLGGMAPYLERRLAIRTFCSAEPLTAVIRGGRAILPVANELKVWP